jgi:HAE1 family hydrophobic/amphiphilic exporter-1
VLYRLVEGRLERRRLLRDLARRPEPVEREGSEENEADGDWTTGVVPKVTGRRAAKA